MGTIIFLLVFFFIIYPLIKIGWKFFVLSRRWRQATDGMRKAYEKAAREAAGKDNEPPAKKKKIDPSVGEYVAFEEITETTTVEATEDKASGTTSIKIESQVEDAVWEEIRD